MSTDTAPAARTATALYRTVDVGTKTHTYVLALSPVGELALRVASSTNSVTDRDETENFTSRADRDAAMDTYQREYRAQGFREIPGYEFMAGGRIHTYEDLLCVTAAAAAEAVCRKALEGGAERVNFGACYSATVTSILKSWRRTDTVKWFGYLAEIGAPLVP